jgi:bifunctional ADP-heptose synthase (sugar kinase/adenylyltransferase)
VIARGRLESLLARFDRLTIGLVGDLFLDRYLEIDPRFSERSVETGLEAYQVTHVRNSPGALGTVMNNLAALGVGRLVPLTVVGDDGHAHDLLAALADLKPVDASHVIRDPGRLTPTYTKPIQAGPNGLWRELNRLDLRNCRPLDPATEQRLLESLEALFAAADGLVVLDQVNEEGWGVISPEVREHLATLSRRWPDKLVFVDSRAHVGHFTCGILKPNVAECLAALGRQPPAGTARGDLKLAAEAARALSSQTGCPIYCTLGQAGMLLVGFDPAGGDDSQGASRAAIHIPGYAVEGPIDPVGAGDSATAGIVAALLSGATPAEAAQVGNLAASITIQQLGTTGTATPADLLARSSC